MEILEKKCPRCGGTSANSSNPSGRCKACLAKLASNKKKPGHWQRAQTKADDALRRQKGKNGTAHKKSKGLGTRSSIVKQTKTAERKTGQKLSPDRKNNSKGYASSNTRMVPEKLNRGRHHVDGKKLRAWQKRLKKSETDAEQFYTYLLAKAHEANDTALLSLLEDMHPNDVTRFIENEDTDAPLKKSEELAKEAAPKLPSASEAPKASGLAAEVGKTHTLEIHPDIDHLYRAKGLMIENKKDKLHINEFKKNGQFGHILNKLPKDSKGFVTPEAIDKHIAELPKTKVNIRVLEGKNRPGEQKHRHDAPEYTLSMDMHPEHKMKMSPKHRKIWDRMKSTQHSWEKEGHGGVVNTEPEGAGKKGLKDLDQVGWVRVDPNKHDSSKGGSFESDAWDKAREEGGQRYTPEAHSSHEQSSNPTESSAAKKLGHEGMKDIMGTISSNANDYDWWNDGDDDPNIQAYNKLSDDERDAVNNIYSKYMPDHDDLKYQKSGFEEHPHWHLDEIQSDFQNPKKIKSATPNGAYGEDGVARSHPEYEATREAIDRELEDDSNPATEKLRDDYNSYLDDKQSDWVSDNVGDYRDSYHEPIWNDTKAELAAGTHPSLQNPALKSAVEKLGPEALDHFASHASSDNGIHSQDFGDHADKRLQAEIVQYMKETEDPKVLEAIPKFEALTPDERAAIGGLLSQHADHVGEAAEDRALDRYDSSGAHDDFAHLEAHNRLKTKDPDHFNQTETTDADREALLEHLSHGHEDPQHALHSAANALGRKLGIKSMSMDMPEDQAKKSVLQTTTHSPRKYVPHPPEKTWKGWHDKLNEHFNSDAYKHDPESWKSIGQPLTEEIAADNDEFKGVADKLGPQGMEAVTNLVPKNKDGWMYQGHGDDWELGTHSHNTTDGLDKETKAKLRDLTPQERDELSSFLGIYQGRLHESVAKQLGLPERPDIHAPEGAYVEDPEAAAPTARELPVHQINTYNKRAKKLGMKPVDKKQILGDHPTDKADHKIQYMNLHKKLAALRFYLEELKKRS